MEKDKNKNPLIIPVNCPPIPYVIQGLTASDMSALAVCGGVSLFLAILIYNKRGGDAISAVGFFLFVMAAAVVIFFRDVYTENMIDKIRVSVKYMQSEKHYIYTYMDDTWQRIEKMDRKETENGEKG